MPLFGDILGVIGNLASGASQYITGQKVLNVDNVANDVGFITGDVLRRTGVTGNGNGSSEVGQAAASAFGGFSQSNPDLVTSLFGSIIGDIIKKNFLIVIVVVGGILYLIFRKK